MNAFLQRINRALRTGNARSLQEHARPMQRLLENYGQREFSARRLCEDVRNRHAKKRLCKEHARILKDLEALRQRASYLARELRLMKKK